MGDRAWAKIQIGGKLPASKLPAFEKLLKGEGLLQDNETYKNVLNGNPNFVEVEDNEVNYANFGIEDDLRMLGLTYLKENAAGDEYEAGEEYWEPGMQDTKYSNTAGGEVSIGVRKILGMIEKIERVSKKLDELPLLLNDDDEQVQYIVKFYTSTPKRKAKPLECLKTYVQEFAMPTQVPPFEIVED